MLGTILQQINTLVEISETNEEDGTSVITDLTDLRYLGSIEEPPARA